MKKQKLTLTKPKLKSRITWGFNPVSRVVPSKKIYSRKKFKIQLY